MSIAQYDKSTVEELLSTVKQLSSNDLNEFTQQFLAWQKRDITEKEAVLLKAIEEHSRLPDAEQERYEELRRKFDQEILNEQEFMEYQSLLQQLEVRNVKRIEALVALAQQRGLTLRGIMVELGLKGKAVPSKHIPIALRRCWRTPAPCRIGSKTGNEKRLKNGRTQNW